MFARFCLSVAYNMPGGDGSDSGAKRRRCSRIRQGERWKSAHVAPVWHLTRRRSDGIIVSELDVKYSIPIVVSLVNDHNQHLGPRVVYLLNASVPLGLILR